ncbi:hypothetical protein [Aeromonas bestiarum]|nr:hypothetical protein [Aeromonas bestiarum]
MNSKKQITGQFNGQGLLGAIRVIGMSKMSIKKQITGQFNG